MAYDPHLQLKIDLAKQFDVNLSKVRIIETLYNEDAIYIDDEYLCNIQGLDEMVTTDKGPFRLIKFQDGDYGIESSDFRHDVMLRVSGDFISPLEKKMYCVNLAKQLNGK